MGNFEHSISKKQSLDKDELQTRLQTTKPLLVINSLLQVNHFSEGSLTLFEIKDRENLNYTMMDLSQPIQRLYSCKSRSCVEIIINSLIEDPEADFIWEAKTITGGYIWYSMKVEPFLTETKECLFILDLFQIQEPVELLKSLDEIKALNSIVEFFSDKKNATNEEMLSMHVEKMENLIENKTKKNTELKEESQRMKKQITVLKKKQKQDKKEQKLKNKNKNKNNKKEQEKEKNENQKKKGDDKNELGEQIVKELQRQFKKVKFQKDQVYRQDNSQTFLRNINILQSKEEVQNKDKKALHQEIEKEEVVIKNMQLKLDEKEKELEEIGNSEEFKEQNKKIKKCQKKKLKLQKRLGKMKEKVQNLFIDQELKKEFDSVSLQLQKKKQKNNKLRLKIAMVKNNQESKFKGESGSMSEQSEFEFGSDFVIEDESLKRKNSEFFDQSGGTNTNSASNTDEENQKKNNNGETKESTKIELTKNENIVPDWANNNSIPTFDEIFQNPVSYEYYKEFLSYQYNAEPLLFYMEVSNFKEYYLRTINKLDSKLKNQEQDNEEDLSLKYRYRYLNAWVFDIISMYIKPDSIFELDLDVELRAKVIKSAIEKDDVNIFDQIQETVYNDLSGEIFEMFKSSHLFIELRSYLLNTKRKNNFTVRKGTFAYNERSMRTLNSSINYEGEHIKHPCKYIETLVESLIDMLNTSYTIGNEQINCEQLRQSVSFRRFEFATCKLQSLRLDTLSKLSPSKNLSFLINLYNALALNAMIVNGPPYNAFSYQKFLNKSMFDIGGRAHSLSDISSILFSDSTTSDQSLSYLISTNSKDPRVHFALVNPDGVIPFVKVYYADHLNQQLNHATNSFIKRNFLYDEKSKAFLVPRVFKTYSNDFGNSLNQMKDWIWKHGNIQFSKKKISLKVVKESKYNGIISFTQKYDFND
ncbi:electron carrier/ protein disulfide oxidoreductase [Anaeramoeba flamelloides]|uniref:Electron carrier/ protein disulfide oxidoreductase n=1 Tax=Anaeramoeba flamelloides TaxID=1746091 RepID=A0ABQ8X1V2_9EUKA|nr:electron carrier/ protein disulfide oxidoreductase [Anaeramoeba flamelloides]